MTTLKVPNARAEARPRRGYAEAPSILTVEEAAGLLRIGRNTCYELIRQRRIPHVRLGRRLLIPHWGLQQWIAREAHVDLPPLPVVDSRLQRH